MEMVGTRGSSNWGVVLRGGTPRFGGVRACGLSDERRPLLRNEGWGFVLHRARPRQLGSWRRALCLASFSRCRALRAAESMIKSKPLNARLSRTQQLVNHTAPG